MSSALKGVTKFYLGIESRDIDSPLFRATNDKRVFKPKFFYVGDCFGTLHLLPGYLQYFIKRQKEIIIVPLYDISAMRGYFFRSNTTKDFRIIRDDYPLLYGGFRFRRFKYGRTILIGEGIKEAEAIAQFYSYSMAVLGSAISLKQSQMLSMLTNRIIFIADNDKWGRRNRILNKKRGAHTVIFPPCKDLGEYWEERKEQVAQFIRAILKAYT